MQKLLSCNCVSFVAGCSMEGPLHSPCSTSRGLHPASTCHRSPGESVAAPWYSLQCDRFAGTASFTKLHAPPLQVPRALWVGNHMWFTGTSWATAFAAVQAVLAALAAGRGAVAWAAAALTCTYFWAVLHVHAAAAGLPSWRHSLQEVSSAYAAQMQPALFAELWKALRGAFP